jgi:hypothetical protein
MTGATLSLLCCPFVMVGAPEEPRYGYLDQPAYSIDKLRRGPSFAYDPQPGDVLLLSNPHWAWSTAYLLSGTGAPGHSALVARLGDGTLGLIEAGFNEQPFVRFVPLAERMRDYVGFIWVRRRKTRITAEQSSILTEYGQTIDGRRYGVLRLLAQLTPFRTRGLIRTYFLGKPKGIRSSYICSEAVLEGLVMAGILNAETTRPSATYPRDMFFDESLIPYIDKHLPLACDWHVPSLWKLTPAP